jgi:hypothetical protein
VPPSVGRSRSSLDRRRRHVAAAVGFLLLLVSAFSVPFPGTAAPAVARPATVVLAAPKLSTTTTTVLTATTTTISPLTTTTITPPTNVPPTTRSGTGHTSATTATSVPTTTHTRPGLTTSTTAGHSHHAPPCPSNINQELQRELAYQPSPRMTALRITRVTAIIATNSVPSSVPGLTGTTVITSVPTGCLVTAGLNGEGFEVVPVTQAQQSFVGNNTYIVWAWDVEPLRSGQLTLDLTISSELKYYGLITNSADIDKIVMIHVMAAPNTIPSWLGTVTNNGIFDGVVTALVLALFANLANEARKARKNRQGPPTGPEDAKPSTAKAGAPTGTTIPTK